MSKKPTDRMIRSGCGAGVAFTPKSVAALKVGLSLTIKKKALKEFDRIQAEITKDAGEIQKFCCR